MRTRSKLLPILMSLVLAVSLCPLPAFASEPGIQSARLTTQAVARTKVYRDNTNNCVLWARKQVPSLPYGLNTLQDKKNIINSHTPVAGSVAIMDGVPASVGHVAVVKSVSGSTITVWESNCIQGWITQAVGTASQLGIYGYYVPKDLPIPAPGPILSGKPQVSIGAGTYMIRSKIGNRVIDIHNASQNDGENAKVWQPAGNMSQIFNIGWNGDLQANYIQLKASGKFLDAEGGDAKASNVVQWSGNGGKNQNWIFEDAGDGYVYIRNLFGYYLDLDNGKDENGANVSTWEYHGGDNQKWGLVKVSGEPKTIISDGSYIVQSKVGNRVIDIHNASKAAGENAKVWQPAGNASQIFTVGRNSDLDANYIQLKASGLFLDSEGGGPYKGNVSQYKGNGGWNQNWFAENAGGGYYYIRNLFGYYLDLDNGKDENGANVSTWEFHGGDNQKWKLLKVSGKVQSSITPGTYSLVSKQSGKALDIAGASAKEGANAQICGADGSASQLFEIAKNTALSAYSIKLKASGLALDAVGGDSKEGNVAQYKDHSGWNQSWFFEDAGDGYYYVRDMLGYYLDVEGGKTADGSNVGVYAFNGANNQKWKLVASVPSGSEQPAQGDSSSSPTDGGEQPSKGGSEAAGKTAIGSASVAGVKSKHYTGEPLTQSPTVTLGGKALVEGVDYELSYSGNVNVGTATMTVTGKGDYEGSKQVAFEITPAPIGQAAVSLADQAYTGAAIDPDVAVELDGRALVRGRDFDASFGGEVRDAGDYTATVAGVGNYAGTASATFRVVASGARSIADAEVSGVGDAAYTGGQVRPVPVVTLGGKALKAGADYEVTYGENVRGTGSVYIWGTGDYVGSKLVTFGIVGGDEGEDDPDGDGDDPDEDSGDPDGDGDEWLNDIEDADVYGVTSRTYTGKAQRQSPVVVLDGVQLDEGDDYVLSYRGNVSAGTATLVITGAGEYHGRQEVAFSIAKANVKGATAAKVKAQKYRKGKAVKPSPKITYKGIALKKGVDYTLAYKNNKKRGTATITVKGKGNFKGTKAVKFKIK